MTRSLFAVAALAVGCGGALHDAAHTPHGPCGGVDVDAARVWNKSVRSQVHASLAGAGPAYAERTARDVTAQMDAVSRAWSEGSRAACARAAADSFATRRTGEPPLKTAEMLCYDAALGRQRAAVEALLHANRARLANSFEIVSGVGEAVERCRHEAVIASFAGSADPLAVAESLRSQAENPGTKAPDAVRLATDALSHVEGALGTDTAESLDYARRLADAERANGETDHAAARYANIILRAEKLLGESHGFLAGVHGALGRLHAAAGATGDAERELRLALSVADRAFGPEHPEAGTAHHDLAAFLWKSQRFPEALKEAQRALAIRVAAFGEASTTVAASLSVEGGILSALGKPEAALDAYTRALAIQSRLLGTNQPELGDTHLALGGTLESLGRLDEAIPEFQRALSIQEDSKQTPGAELAATHGKIGTALRAAKRYDDALFEHHLAVQLLKESPVPVDAAVAREEGAIASILEEQGKLEDATETYREVLRLDEGALGKDHPTTGTDHHRLGRVLALAKQVPEAVSELKLALTIGQKANPVDEEAVRELRDALSKLGAKTP